MKKTVQLSGRFGNVLWELAAAIKEFGSPEEFVAIHDQQTSKGYEQWFQGINFVHNAGKREGGSVRHDQKDYVPIDAGTCHLAGYRQHIRYIEWVDMSRFLILKPTKHEYTILHVRGTDYFSYQYPVPGRDYYLRAVEQLDVHPRHCRIVTDDVKFARNLLPEVEVWKGDMTTDFCRLLGARFVVSSSSTFSWWGGYLGVAEQVIIPSKWFYGRVPDEYSGVVFPRACVLDI